MNTPVLIGLMVAMAVLLLVVAVIIDRVLERRMRMRRLAEESGVKSDKRDLADTLIEAMGRTSEAVRNATRSARQSDAEPKA